MKRLVLALAIVAALVSQVQAQEDPHNYGPWLEQNMDMDFYGYRYYRGNHRWNALKQPWFEERTFINATYSGSVFGKNQDGQKQQGTVAITFRNADAPTFDARFSGIPALMDIEGGRMHSADVYIGNIWDWGCNCYADNFAEEWTLDANQRSSETIVPFNLREVGNDYRFEGEWKSGTTRLEGHFYGAQGQIVSGTVSGHATESRYDANGSISRQMHTFDGVFRADK